MEQDRHIADQLADHVENTGVSTFAYTRDEDAVGELDTLLAGGTGLISP